MIKFKDNKKAIGGFTIVEILIAVFISLIMLTVVYMIYGNSLKVYGKIEKASNIQEQARVAIEQLDRLFDRWGVGVPYDNSATSCDVYPPTEYPLQRAASLCFIIKNDGTSLTFYGSFGGIGLVKSITNNANLISCRLDNSSSQNYYYVWRGENPWDNDQDASNGFPYFSLNNLNPSNAECVNWSETPNATVSASLSSNTKDTVNLNPGDIITRVPHKITLYKGDNENKLYAKFQDCKIIDSNRDCNGDTYTGDTYTRLIAENVEQFLVEDITSNSNQNPLLKITLTLKDINGQTYTIQRIYTR